MSSLQREGALDRSITQRRCIQMHSPGRRKGNLSRILTEVHLCLITCMLHQIYLPPSISIPGLHLYLIFVGFQISLIQSSLTKNRGIISGVFSHLPSN